MNSIIQISILRNFMGVGGVLAVLFGNAGFRAWVGVQGMIYNSGLFPDYES
ncbi:hypothetical protein [Pseudoalteromonas sp. NBT06-2]|uniref:hypothetical protein n=1 Tax=Pseudoalteromonas sp. NBT06-2 TaxID=2025950 RepID=UPI001483398B|nr:hypothetical protein [Pseudoalteromonas sp. NBT06-2]